MVTNKTTPDDKGQWYLDIGCSTHMTGHKDWFVCLDERMKSKVRFADDSTMLAEGIGNVLIQRKDGRETCIEDVLYVPGISSNLLSLGQLLQKGFKITMEDMMMLVYDKTRNLIIKTPLTRNRTFKIGTQALEHECLSAVSNKEEWLWHYRLGHLNFKDLAQMHKLARGIPQLHNHKRNAEIAWNASRQRSPSRSLSQ